jgi:hypothetical protein
MASDDGDENGDDKTTTLKDKILALYDLEYKSGVKRHDDIYKSMWTNFSYMAILSGGILTFSADGWTWRLSPLLPWAR